MKGDPWILIDNHESRHRRLPERLAAGPKTVFRFHNNPKFRNIGAHIPFHSARAAKTVQIHPKTNFWHLTNQFSLEAEVTRWNAAAEITLL